MRRSSDGCEGVCLRHLLGSHLYGTRYSWRFGWILLSCLLIALLVDCWNEMRKNDDEYNRGILKAFSFVQLDPTCVYIVSTAVVMFMFDFVHKLCFFSEEMENFKFSLANNGSLNE